MRIRMFFSVGRSSGKVYSLLDNFLCVAVAEGQSGQGACAVYGLCQNGYHHFVRWTMASPVTCAICSGPPSRWRRSKYRTSE